MDFPQGPEDYEVFFRGANQAYELAKKLWRDVATPTGKWINKQYRHWKESRK